MRVLEAHPLDGLVARCRARSSRSSRSIRARSGGCVAGRPNALLRATGSRWNASLSAAARRSRFGIATMPSETFISAEASAAGEPVSATAPSSAANSR